MVWIVVSLVIQNSFYTGCTNSGSLSDAQCESYAERYCAKTCHQCDGGTDQTTKPSKTTKNPKQTTPKPQKGTTKPPKGTTKPPKGEGATTKPPKGGGATTKPPKGDTATTKPPKGGSETTKPPKGRRNMVEELSKSMFRVTTTYNHIPSKENTISRYQAISRNSYSLFKIFLVKWMIAILAVMFSPLVGAVN